MDLSTRNMLLRLLLCFWITISHGAITPNKLEKSNLCPDPSTPPLSVFIGLKTTTATPAYSARTTEIMNSWGPYAAGNLALITDGINPKHNIELQHSHPSLPIIEVIGSERFGDYKNNTSRTRRIGFASQRVKVRSFIKWFHDSVRPDSGIEWLCYIDDDMFVNMNILNNALAAVLANPPPTCSRLDRCVVADVGLWTQSSGNIVPYSNAVWCMTMPTLNAVHQLLLEKDDNELMWIHTDDVGFALVLQKYLNITYTDSLSMFSINNKVVVDPPDRAVNPVGSYSIRKANIRGNKTEWFYFRDHKAPSDVLARLGVLNLPHVNYTDLCERHGAHELPYGTSPNLVVDMKQWNAYVDPQPTCRRPLKQTLRVGSSESYIMKYKL